MMDFKSYIYLQEYSLSSDGPGVATLDNQATASYKSPNIWTGNSSAQVPQHTLNLPQVQKKGKVVSLEYKAGGIAEIRMDDGTTLRMTTGDLKRMGNKIIPHQSRLTVSFQRDPSDSTKSFSNISKITCENDPPVLNLNY